MRNQVSGRTAADHGWLLRAVCQIERMLMPPQDHERTECALLFDAYATDIGAAD